MKTPKLESPSHPKCCETQSRKNRSGLISNSLSLMREKLHSSSSAPANPREGKYQVEQVPNFLYHIIIPSVPSFLVFPGQHSPQSVCKHTLPNDIYWPFHAPCTIFAQLIDRYSRYDAVTILSNVDRGNAFDVSLSTIHTQDRFDTLAW